MAVTPHLNVVQAVLAAGKPGVKVGLGQQHAVAVDLEDLVPGHQHLLALVGKALLERGDGVIRQRLERHQQAVQDQVADKEVHQRAGRDDERPPRNLGARKAVRAFGLAVLPFHDAGAAEGQ